MIGVNTQYIILETGLSRQSNALLLTTENKEKITRAPETHAKQTKKLALATTNIKLQNSGFVAFDNMRPGNEVGAFL